jgi:hypothetical protein
MEEQIMDLMDTAQLLGNFGEFIGAIAVVATLVYIAVQVRHSREAMVENTIVVRSAAYEAYNETANSFLDYQGHHAASLAASFDSTEPYSKWTTEHQLVYDALLMKMFNSMETTYLHYRDGTMPNDVFEGKVEGFQEAMQTRFNAQDWQRHRSGGFSRDFQRFMEDELIGAQPEKA